MSMQIQISKCSLTKESEHGAGTSFSLAQVKDYKPQIEC